MRRVAWVGAVAMVALAASCGGTPARGARVGVGAGPIQPLPDDQSLRASDGQPSEVQPPVVASRLESAHAIGDEATWQRLAARPATASVARTEVVKFLVDLEDGRRLWFIDSAYWQIHYRFAVERLNVGDRPGDHDRFNVREYRRPERRFELGTITHYLDSDLWTLELISGDNLPGDRILALFEQLRDALWIGDQLRFRPLSALHQRSIASVRDRLPLTTSVEVFAGLRYQPLTQGVAYGTLRIVRGTLDTSTVRPDQILVLEHVPDEIPVVGGVITQQLQAPLGHIAVLCANRGTPNMGLRGAVDSAELRELEGQLVELTVGTQEFGIRPATLEQAEASWSRMRPAQPQVPRLDASDRRLRSVCDLRLDDADVAGAKAAQLGEACSIGGAVRTPGGFVVPFAHYLEHLGDSGIANGLPQMLADPTFRSDATVRARQLDQVRQMIERSAVEPALVRDMRRQMQRTAPSARWILRSSTNAEDLAGFTGAGLYRSVIVSAGASEQELTDALREVWASVWLQGAYEEREWYRIDHRTVAMAVMAQPFVDGATANGVAITANPFYAARPAQFINAQALGGTVTGAGGDELPEQHLIYTYSQAFESELLSRSSRNGGAILLGEAELLRLNEALNVLHLHFVGNDQTRGRWPPAVGPNAVVAVDVEFLIAGDDRHVVILQARPYTVVYGPDQR